MSESPLTRTVTVKNTEGLHARPADALVRLVDQFESNVKIGKRGELVDCNSILSILTLGAEQGTELQLSADGPDAESALKAIGELFDAKFEENSENEGAATGG